MTRVKFVKLERQEKARHLCEIASHFMACGQSSLVHVQDENQAVTLDRFMWVWDKAAFVPHAYDNGSVDCLDEPVVIVTSEHNPNGARVLIMSHPCSLDFMQQFELVVDFAETYDPGLAEEARERFRTYRNKGLTPYMAEK